MLGNKEAVTRIVLHGLMGELDGKTYAGLMLPMKGNDDQWLAEVLTYIRTAFGNNASAITKDDVATIENVYCLDDKDIKPMPVIKNSNTLLMW